MSGGVRVLGVIAFFLLFAIAAAYPAEVKVFVVAEGSPQDQGMSRVLSRAALLAVQSEGFAGVVPSGTATSPTQTPALLSEAKGKGAAFLLLLRYRTAANILTLETSLVETASGSTLSARTATHPLNLNLDSGVTADARIVFADPRAAAAMKRARELASAAQRPSGSGASAKPSGEQAGATAPKPGEAQGHREPEKPALGLALSGQGAPLILIGNGSSFFRYGALGTVFGGARYPLSGITLHGGLQVGVAGLFPVPGLPAAKVYTVLSGLEIGAATPTGSLVGVGLNATGGAAVIALQMPGAPLLAKTVPFVEGGVAAYVHVTKRLAIGIDVAFLAVFEGSYPIMGLAPALVVGTGF